MKLEDWFDNNNLEHLKALEHLNDNGAWPIGFLPDDVEIEPLSSTFIFLRLGKEYLDFKIEALEQE